MDPLDHVRAGLDGLACAVCEGPVPADAIQLLAHRDALAFVQVECPACRSTTLAFLLEGEAGDEQGQTTEAPVSSDDVLDMHLFLRDWRGGTSALLGGDAPGPR
ncbi:MAG: hypothetical protein HY263_01605 [Chloroflexi bacterium]|nr:hypothetical protein [Chloroflexota bacterium]